MYQDVIDKKVLLVKHVDPKTAQSICRTISATLPEWFAIPEANLNYEQGMLSRTSFAAFEHNEAVGLVTIEIQYPTNGIIYWLGIKQDYHRKGLGHKLLQAAENHCLAYGCASLTVETLSPKEDDAHYLSTYEFYLRMGFSPLFEKVVHEHLMVFLQKTINLNNYEFIDLTHNLSADVPHWGVDVGFKYNARTIESSEPNSEVKFRVQRLEMSSGIGTHMDAPSHCFANAPSINHIPLTSLITRLCVVDVSERVDAKYSVSTQDIMQFEAQHGIIPEQAFVIIYTGWSKKWDQPEQYRNEKIFPNISLTAAQLLLARNVVGVGIDTLSPDAFGSNFPVHQALLGAGKYIIENVANAERMDPVGNFIFALPIKVQDGTEAPMRLIGMKIKKVL